MRPAPEDAREIEKAALDAEALRERIVVARRALDDVESAPSALPSPRVRARVERSWE
ncbi:hypothetical protein ACF06X_13425 [Streptomyces sp. NPDC015346]|uniref:hypothetical protein n=1 Tax=Streptomyces sp. NPDC015346 TaxID=3364954 RepID=UPI0036FD420B